MLVINMWINVGLILGAYIYGSTPFVWSIARLRGIDLRQRSSRSVGSANLTQSAGAWAGAIGGVGDFSKGVLPIVIGHYLLDADLPILCLSGLAALAGQMWPVWLGFYGGRGNSVSGGIIVGFILSSYLPWGILLVLIPIFLAIAKRKLSPAKDTPTMSVPLACLLGFALVPLLTWLWGKPQVISFTFTAVVLLLITRRLTADISADLRRKPRDHKVAVMLINRFLYDRNYKDRYR